MSGDSSSDSRDLPPVERRALGFGDFSELGLAKGSLGLARGMGGDGELFSSAERRCNTSADSLPTADDGEGKGADTGDV